MLINFCVHVMCVFSFYKTFQALPLLPQINFALPSRESLHLLSLIWFTHPFILRYFVKNTGSN